MKLTFIGATHEVTGSCSLLEVGGHYGLIDYGTSQGKDVYENVELPISPSNLEFVLLTHAHIDHSGNLPLLCKNGFTGKIFSTQSTYELCSIMLRDSAHIHESEAEWQNRKAKRSNNQIVEPLYTISDVQKTMELFCPCPYSQKIKVNENLEIRFTDVGHLLGSSSIEVWAAEDGISKKIVFSGDIGNTNQPLIKDPCCIADADYVLMESTYGDRLHGDNPDYIGVLSDCIQRALDRGGNVVIPAFAVGRTQEMLYFIRHIKEHGLVHGHDDFPVYVDSPLANEATSIFLNCETQYLDEETQALVKAGINPIVFPNLHKTISSDESKAINFDETPKVIISASGMCEAGRIRHHLKHNLWRSESIILFVGYQSVGTFGRILHDGAKKVKLFGEDISVNAEIATMTGKSGHADKNGLISWLSAFSPKPDMVFVNHGDDDVCQSFADCLKTEYGYNSYAPYSGTVFDLKNNRFIEKSAGIPISKKITAASRNNSVFDKLIAAIKALESVAQSCKGLSNKDISKFTDQINSLCKKWSR